MTVEYSYMFHVPIFKVHLNPWNKIKKQIIECLPKNQKKIDSSGYLTDYTVSNTEYSEDVYKIISPHLKQITENAFGKELPEISPVMWCQRYVKNTYHEIHNHGNRGLSGIIYLDYDPQYHKATKFYSPFDDIFTGYQNDYVPTIEEGDMIIFPSVIKHTSQVQESEKERTILSFNIFPNG